MLSRIHGDEDAHQATIDFAVNVSPNQPHWLSHALSSQLSNLAAYPSATETQAVTSLIAAYHQVPPSHVLLTAGAAEGFALLPKLGITTPAVIHPGFSEPDSIFTELGIPVQQIVLTPPFASDFSVPEQTDALIIGNPTNPTGVLWPKDQLLNKVKENRYLIVDEAFMDLVGEHHSLASQVPETTGLIVLRSLTKTWALAGLRIGYVIAQPVILHQLAAGRAHWPVGTLQLAAARAVFTHGIEELPQLRDEVVERRKAMLKALAEVNLNPVSDSQAPFVLVKVADYSPQQAEQLRQELLRRGIAIRRCDTFPGLGWNYWRLAVRDFQQVHTLIAELKTITQGEKVEHRS